MTHQKSTQNLFAILSVGSKREATLMDKLKTKLGYIFYILTITIITLIIFFAFVWALNSYYIFVDNHFKIGNSLSFSNQTDTLHNAFIVFLTFFLVFFTAIIAHTAHSQMKKLTETSSAEFLLNLDNRWGSDEILKGREIIHKLHCKTKFPNCSAKHNQNKHIDRISDEIMKIKNDVSQYKDGVLLLNLLEFLETIAYFANRGRITSEDVDDLLGSSIEYYYLVFEKWIIERRDNYNPNFFGELIKLIKNIEKIENICNIKARINIYN